MDVPRRLCCGNADFLPFLGGWLIVDVPGYPFVSWVSINLDFMSSA